MAPSFGLSMGVSVLAMPSSSVAFLLSTTFAFSLTSALPWPGPQETKVYHADEFSPKPTGVPADPVKLFKRSSPDVNVCGWARGDPELVQRCGSGSSCIHDVNHGVIGCCATAGSCTDGVYTTCLDQGSDGWKSTKGMINNGVLTCGESSSCYRNSYTDNYMQFLCGETSMAAQVQLTYSGQPTDMRLQLVYTGVKFTPISRKPESTASKTSDSSTETDPAVAGKANPTKSSSSSESPETAPPATEDDNAKVKGVIAGSTIGGFAAATGIIALIIIFLRRRQKKNKLRVGGFVSMHQKKQHRASGPLRRVLPYSPVEHSQSLDRSSTEQEIYMTSPHQEPNDTTYVSPFTGHPDESHQAVVTNRQPQDLLGESNLQQMSQSADGPKFNYETAVAIPISRLNKDSPHQSLNPFASPEDYSHSLGRNSEIEDFSQSWQNAIASHGYAPDGYLQDRGTHIHEGDMPETTDVGLAGAVRRVASNLAGNGRSVDPIIRSEAMRHQTDIGGSLLEADRPGNPLQEQVMMAFNAATRMGGVADQTPLTPVRYQLIDDSAPKGEGLPVLDGPSLARKPRPMKSE